jgi:cytochrome c-type biogenesis protein CcmH/NrfF
VIGMWRALLLSILFAAGGAVLAAGAAPDVAADPALEARVNAIAAELRCLVCQNQSLADSHAELALQLKGQVREQLQAGRNEQQVVAYMTQRYGDFVLYRPPFKATTVLLWAGPGLLLAIGLGVLGWNLRRKVPANELSQADAARAASLLDKG